MKKAIKVIALVLALAMVVAFAACGKKGGDNTTDPANPSSEYANMKVGFIFLHDENSTYDLNFINAAKAACAELGIPAENYILKTNIDESQACTDTAKDLVDQGCKIIFADSFGHEPFLIEAAKEFPDVQFCHATGTRAHTEKLANYHNAFASIYEGRYLAGIAAGMKLNEMIANGKIPAGKTPQVGYVGAFTYAEVVSGYTSFFLGVRSVCPTAVMEVTFTGSWYNETAEKEAAVKLISRGADLISQHADSMGAPTACEDAGVPDVSYNGSTKQQCPNTFIVSSRIDWTPYFTYAIKAAAKGETIADDWTGDLKTGSVLLTEVNTDVAAAGTVEAIEAAKAQLEAGTLHVFDTSKFTVEGKALTTYKADVDTDADYQGDTEVIADGYFHESEYRSAPYFDLNIDGITLLDTAF